MSQPPSRLKSDFFSQIITKDYKKNKFLCFRVGTKNSGAKGLIIRSVMLKKTFCSNVI